MALIERQLQAAPRTWRLDLQMVYRAHERAYQRAGLRDLTSILATFQASPRELGGIFGVSRQAIVQWSGGGVPANRLADVGHIADVARRLRQTFKRERIPAIVRQANPGLEGSSVLAALAQPDGANRVVGALDRLLSYVPAPDSDR